MTLEEQIKQVRMWLNIEESADREYNHKYVRHLRDKLYDLEKQRQKDNEKSP